MATNKTTPAPPEVTQPDFIYSDSDPYERAVTRLNGIRALTNIAQGIVTSEDTEFTPVVWEPLWYFLGLAVEDVKRDMYAFYEKSRGEKS
jgi:hypothetical protein